MQEATLERGGAVTVIGVQSGTVFLSYLEVCVRRTGRCQGDIGVAYQAVISGHAAGGGG